MLIKKLNYDEAPRFLETYKRFVKLSKMNPEGYLNKIYCCGNNNIIKTFVAMLITCNNSSNVDILIKGKEFYDNYFSN